MKKIYAFIILILAVSSVKAQSFFMLTYQAAPTIPTAKFNFSSTASAVSGWTNFYGNPTSSQSFTDAGTGWTLITITAGWATYGGFFGGVGNGATTGSTDGAFSQASINSNLYTTTNYASNGYGLEFTNLPAGTYSIELIGSIPTGVFNTGGGANFHVLFGSGSDNAGTPYLPNGTGSTGNLVPLGPGTTGVTTGSFTGTITTSQVIKIAIGTDLDVTTGSIGVINGLIIKKIG